MYTYCLKVIIDLVKTSCIDKHTYVCSFLLYVQVMPSLTKQLSVNDLGNFCANLKFKQRKTAEHSSHTSAAEAYVRHNIAAGDANDVIRQIAFTSASHYSPVVRSSQPHCLLDQMYCTDMFSWMSTLIFTGWVNPTQSPVPATDYCIETRCRYCCLIRSEDKRAYLYMESNYLIQNMCEIYIFLVGKTKNIIHNNCFNK